MLQRQPMVTIGSLLLLLLLLLLAEHVTVSLGKSPPHVIVIGSGVGGVTIANFYSADPDIRVLLLEQGPGHCAACDLSLGAQSDPSAYNQHIVYPQAQPFLKLMRAPAHILFAGKGGNSKIYGCVDAWPSREFLNSRFPTGFRYDDLLPYLKKNENHYCHYLPEIYTGIDPSKCETYHGKGGHFDISPQAHREWSVEIKALVEYANSSDGPGWNADYNNPEQRLGFHEEQSFRRMADRTDPYSARFRADAQISFLNSTVAARPNLEVITNAHVERIVIHPISKRPVAVLYSVNDTGLETAVPLVRVFVCGGVLATPQLLHVSGVGPADFLDDAGIAPLVINNAIGKTLKSHMAFIMGFQTNAPVAHNASMSSFNALQWFFSTGLHDSAFKDDVQVELLEGLFVRGTDAAADGLPEEETLGFLTGQTQFPYLSAAIKLHHTLANGYVRASTPSVRDPPTWDLGWGFAPFFGGDLSRLLTAMAIVRSVFLGNNSFANTYIKGEVHPGPYYREKLMAFGIVDDAVATSTFGVSPSVLADFFFLQDQLTHFFHLTSTVPLGAATDMLGQINGLHGVSVCDASLLPDNPDSNPSALIAAICRKIAHDTFAMDFPHETNYA